MLEIILTGIVLIGFLFGYVVGRNAQTRYELENLNRDKEYKQKTEQAIKEQNEKAAKRKAELQEKLENETERYIVEVTTKDGTVYKTKEFEPCITCGEWITRSREIAEQYVYNNSYQNSGTLILFGDEYVCKADIKSVRLVKVK